VTQPTFSPTSDVAQVRASRATSTPELARPKKAGLLGAPAADRRRGQGTPGPDGGYALTLVEHLMHDFVLLPSESHHDVMVGVAALAAKRAGLMGRGPTRTDVEVAADLFGFRHAATPGVLGDRAARFSGLGHSYFRTRAFVDSVDAAVLLQTAGGVTPLAELS
jgi:hypothetical protein